MILEATPSRLVLVHEVAHQWFYGMVGLSQFRDPWLDEAFASWAEAVVDGPQGLSTGRRSRWSGLSAARWSTTRTTTTTSPSSTTRAGRHCSPPVMLPARMRSTPRSAATSSTDQAVAST